VAAAAIEKSRELKAEASVKAVDLRAAAAEKAAALVDPRKSAGEEPVVPAWQAVFRGNDAGRSDMGVEFFRQMPVKTGLKLGSEGFEVLARSIHSQPILVQGEGKDEDFFGSDAWRIGACLSDIVHAHRGT
jgi:hypothetical protein